VLRGGDSDGEPELFELGHEATGLAVGIATTLEVVVTEVLEHLAGAEECQITSTRLWATATAALFGPRRRAIWRY